MLITIKLDENLLNFLHLIQSKKNLSINESQMGLFNDWQKATKDYFFKINTDLIKKLGLTKNQYCFDAIMSFAITDEMNNTLYEELGQFEFKYYGAH